MILQYIVLIKQLPFAKNNIEIGVAKGYANLANTYQYKGEYPEAIKYYIKSIKIFEKTKDSTIISQSYQTYQRFIHNS